MISALTESLRMIMSMLLLGDRAGMLFIILNLEDISWKYSLLVMG